MDSELFKAIEGNLRGEKQNPSLLCCFSYGGDFRVKLEVFATEVLVIDVFADSSGEDQGVGERHVGFAD